MPFQLSPGVVVVEKDFTSIIPAVSTSTGAFAGVFKWGPVLEPTTIASENILVQRFGKPDDSTFASFFTAANFLSYTNNLLVTRVDTANQKNAVSDPTDILDPLDNITVIDQEGVKIKNFDHYIDQYVNGAGTFGEWAAKYPGTLGNSLLVSMADTATFSTWAYRDEFDGNPGTTSHTEALNGSDDGLHVIVIDEDGLWTGVRGSILEKYSFLSKASDALRTDGTNNYYKDVINLNSRYIWWMDHTSSVTNWGTEAAAKDFDTLVAPVTTSLAGGKDDYVASDANLIEGWDFYANSEVYDISLVPCGKVSAVVARHIIQNVVEARRDCVAFVSPFNVVGLEPIVGTDSVVEPLLLAYKDLLGVSTSYAVMDSGAKYQYDRYNDTYRWVPLNADVAGLCARTDYTNDAWWSPGGFNRGQVKNVVKLGVNPGKTLRDNLYKNNINPIVNFRGEGPVLFGDKTMLTKPSAFDRINVRRLFIVLEKAIATAARYQLFEFNDSFTRAMFVNMVEPFLRDVQGRRGIFDFRVKCDETNNTGEVIDRNEFIAEIFIKPARAINFINLTFVAARTGVDFDEIGA